MNRIMFDIYNLIQELSWCFGSQGLGGKYCGDLSFIEFIALKKLCEHDDITVQEMAKKLNITKSGTSKIIDRLENKSYVFREPSPVDGRVCYIRITDKGVNEVSKIIKRYTDYVSEMLKDLDPIVLDHIKKVLELLVILEARRVYHYKTTK